MAPGGHLCSPAPGPRKASLDQVLHYFLSQKPQLAGPQGRRIPRACGHMRRPWKRHCKPTFYSLESQTSSEPKPELISPIGHVQAHSRNSTSDRSLVPPVCTDGFRSQGMFLLRRPGLPIFTWSLTTAGRFENAKGKVGRRTHVVEVSIPMRPHALRRKPAARKYPIGTAKVPP